MDPDKLLKFISEKNAKNIVLINKIIPKGGYIKSNELITLIEKLSHLENIIIDESKTFILHMKIRKNRLSIIESLGSF